MRSSSRRPCGSKRQRSTAVAWAENRAKLTPLPSKVAPSGAGAPSSMRYIAILVGDQARRNSAAQRLSVAKVHAFATRWFRSIADAARGGRHPARAPSLGFARHQGLGRHGREAILGQGLDKARAPVLDRVVLDARHEGGPALAALLDRHDKGAGDGGRGHIGVVGIDDERAVELL